MTSPARLNFTIYQGTTFSEDLRWESSDRTYIPITNITKAAPVVITAPGHGVPLNWRVKFTNILGMTDLNSADTYYQVSAKSTTTITVNDINSLGFKDYTSGGIVEYNTPIDMTGYTAVMQIRLRAEDIEVIQELSTANGLIVINNTNKTITLNLSAQLTASYDFTTAVYGLNLTSSGGQVIPFCGGMITLIKEVVR